MSTEDEDDGDKDDDGDVEEYYGDNADAKHGNEDEYDDV